MKSVVDLLHQISVYKGNETSLLVSLVNIIRTSNTSTKSAKIEDYEDLIFLIDTHPELSKGLQEYLERLCNKKSIVKIITEANLISDSSFYSEIRDRIILKFLPEYSDSKSAEYIISDVFYKENDGKWVSELSEDWCIKLLDVLEIEGIYEKDNQNWLIMDLILSIKILSHRIAGNAMHSGFIQIVPEYYSLENPFASLQEEVNAYLKDIEIDYKQRSEEDINYRQIRILSNQCKDYIQKAYKNIPVLGISFKAHQKLMMVENMLERLNAAIDMIVIKNDRSSKATLVMLIKSLIIFNAGKSKISDYINQTTQTYAREITRNIAIKGEQYITTSKAEYWSMFKAALGGGALVSIACLIKLKMTYIETSLFTKAIYLSLNYSLVFIAIYLLHFSLATKQPAMTAASLANQIDLDIQNKSDFESLAELVSRIWRSQFIAFTGNVLMAFPTALLCMFSWTYIFEENAASTKAHYLISELNIFTSPAIFHAAIAGVFLFFSGLIAGNISNRNKVMHIPQRIADHPILKQFTTLRFRTKLSEFVDHYWAGIISNFWFGVFMGSVGIVGIILGLNLDIRHITFAAGNFAIGLYGYGFNLSAYDIFHSVLGITIIGFVNFSVSFGLSLFLALRSRGIKLSELKNVLRSIKNSFLRYPLSYFYPPNT
jgi:site-specific recombinase